MLYEGPPIFFRFFSLWFVFIAQKEIYNHMQNIWNKLEKSSKTGQGKKSLMSTFACFLTATAKV